MNNINTPIEKILFTEEQIIERVKELACKISEDYKDKEPLLLAVLNGSFMFVADLMREMKIPVSINFIYATSYGQSTVSGGNVQINEVKGFDPHGKDIILVEDIIDTGRTLSKIRERLYQNGANSIEICTFLDKPERRVVDISAKYTGFEVPDEFVVGYGLDFAYKYRQFPFLGVLKPEYYE